MIKRQGSQAFHDHTSDGEKDLVKKTKQEIKEVTETISAANESPNGGTQTVLINPDQVTAPVRDAIPGKDSSDNSVRESIDDFLLFVEEIARKLEHDFAKVKSEDLLQCVVGFYSKVMLFRLIFLVVQDLIQGCQKNEEFFHKYSMLHKDLMDIVTKDNLCNKYIQLIIAFMKKFFQEKVNPMCIEASSPKANHSMLIPQVNLLVVAG